MHSFSGRTRVLSRLGVLLATLLLALLPLAALAQDAGDAPDATAESAALEVINQYRQAIGVPPMAFHPALQESAAGHVRYYEANLGSPALAGYGLHQQEPKAPGFTGVTMGERARAAGYNDGAVTENAGFGPIEAAVHWYMGTVNHRLPLIHPNAVDVGMARSGAGLHIVDVGLRRDPLDIELPSVYPANGATDVPRAWDGSETPDPAPGIPRPLGYPITVAFARHQQVDWQVLELRDSAGTTRDVSTPRTDWMRASAIIPHQPLAPGEIYTVHVEAVVDGSQMTRATTFTTRPW